MHKNPKAFYCSQLKTSGCKIPKEGSSVTGRTWECVRLFYFWEISRESGTSCKVWVIAFYGFLIKVKYFKKRNTSDRISKDDLK